MTLKADATGGRDLLAAELESRACRQIPTGKPPAVTTGALLTTSDNKVIATALMSRDGPLSMSFYVDLEPQASKSLTHLHR